MTMWLHFVEVDPFFRLTSQRSAPEKLGAAIFSLAAPWSSALVVPNSLSFGQINPIITTF